VSPEHLAGHALDLADELSAADLDHLDGCAHCRDELHALREVADLGRQPGTSRVPLAPPSDIWTRITTELAADSPATTPSDVPSAGPSAGSSAGTASPSTGPAPAPSPTSTPVPRHAAGAVPDAAASGDSRADGPDGRPADLRGYRARRSPRRLALLAAAVGLVVGVAGTLGVARALRPAPSVPNAGPPVEVLARTTLTALPGQTGTGSAELLRTSTATELRVRVDVAQNANRYHELWLINTDGKRMYSLGTLPASGSADYPLPPALAEQLQGYTIVDVSIEPYDGNSEHSHHSLVRGTLP
jgi:hypothetical protein